MKTSTPGASKPPDRKMLHRQVLWLAATNHERSPGMLANTHAAFEDTLFGSTPGIEET